MRLARYWARENGTFRDRTGQVHHRACWGWSETSQQEAVERAKQRLQQVAQGLLAAASPGPRASPDAGRAGQYGYGLDQPLREQIVEEILDEHGQAHAVVTRNRMGALVLNTRDLMFIDIDMPPAKPVGLAQRLSQWFFPRPAHESGMRSEIPLGQRLEAQLAALEGHGARLYRTCQGFRCMIVDRPIVPDSPECNALFDRLGVDPLYARLCKKQQSYRARLTPKFWRCGADRPPKPFPWNTPEEEEEFSRWAAHYAQASRGLGTCRLVGQFGAATMLPTFAMLVELHDRITRAAEDLPLA